MNDNGTMQDMGNALSNVLDVVNKMAKESGDVFWRPTPGRYSLLVSKFDQKVKETEEGTEFPSFFVQFTILDGEFEGRRVNRWYSLNPSAKALPITVQEFMNLANVIAGARLEDIETAIGAIKDAADGEQTVVTGVFKTTKSKTGDRTFENLSFDAAGSING